MKRYEEYRTVNLQWFDCVPIAWNVKRLKNITSYVSRGQTPLYTEDSTCAKVVNQATFSRGFWSTTKMRYTTVNPVGNASVPQKGDILLASTGGGVLGKVFYFDDPDVYIADSHVTIIRLLNNVNSRFLHYYLSVRYEAINDLLARGSTNQTELQEMALKNMPVPVPPRAEQDQIVRYLDWQVSKINRLIAAKRKEIELLKDNLKSAVSCLSTHGIGQHDMCKSEIYWLKDYPANWRVTKLKYILQKHKREVPENAELLICSNSGEVTKRGDNKLGLVAASDYIYQGVSTGDLLIHGMDTWHGAIAISKYDGMCTPVVHVCSCKEEIRFVAYYLKMMAYTKVFKAISNGVRQNTSDFRSWDKVGDLLICLPTIEEQIVIANRLDELTIQTKEGISCFECQIEKLIDLRTRLISDVVTGQVDVRGIKVPDDEYINNEITEEEFEEESENNEEE